MENDEQARPARDWIAEFRDYGDTYRTFYTADGTGRARTFFGRLEALDTTTVYPLLLELFRRNGAAGGAAEMGQVYVDLESFLMRRLLRLILEALEAQLRSDKSEDITLNGKLTMTS